MKAQRLARGELPPAGAQIAQAAGLLPKPGLRALTQYRGAPWAMAGAVGMGIGGKISAELFVRAGPWAKGALSGYESLHKRISSSSERRPALLCHGLRGAGLGSLPESIHLRQGCVGLLWIDSPTDLPIHTTRRAYLNAYGGPGG